jgi:hypothetical protein
MRAPVAAATRAQAHVTCEHQSQQPASAAGSACSTRARLTSAGERDSTANTSLRYHSNMMLLLLAVVMMVRVPAK